MNILFTILYLFAVIAFILGGIALLKTFVFNKVKINKFIPLAISIILLLIQVFFRSKNIIISTSVTLIAVFAFAWFFDIVQTGGPKKEKKIVIKPKAKPNRAKNSKK